MDTALAIGASTSLVACPVSFEVPLVDGKEAPLAERAPVSGAETGVVTAVVDGDTIDVDECRVRTIGMDTPEIGRGGDADECYAQEARDYLDGLVRDRDVQILIDPSRTFATATTASSATSCSTVRTSLGR